MAILTRKKINLYEVHAHCENCGAEITYRPDTEDICSILFKWSSDHIEVACANCGRKHGFAAGETFPTVVMEVEDD